MKTRQGRKVPATLTSLINAKPKSGLQRMAGYLSTNSLAALITGI
ncbi:MAG: hypothetical protein SGI96_17175 [Bacteroidota bacterium]|nr:hypothetical protein [Bacteroidota bacterium]